MATSKQAKVVPHKRAILPPHPPSSLSPTNIHVEDNEDNR